MRSASSASAPWACPWPGNLLAAGHEVTVASRGRGPIDGPPSPGRHRRRAPPRGVAEAAEVIFLCVPNSPEVVEVVDAMLPALGPGKIVVDCSTIDPEVERAQHDRVAATGARYLDAPLSGGTAGAQRARSRSWWAATPPTLADASPRSSPSPGWSCTSAGPGMGQVVKLCNNLIYAAQMTATAEATALAVQVRRRHGEALRGADPRHR